MGSLTDRAVLFLFCLLVFPFQDVAPMPVVACLLAITLSMASTLLPKGRRRSVFLAVCGSAQLFLPPLCLFFPLISYDLFPEKQPDGRIASPVDLADYTLWLSCFLFCGLYRRDFGAAHAFLPHTFRVFFLLFGSLLAFLLRSRTDGCTQLRLRLLRMRDDDTEIQLLLKERNQSLLERQNSAIYTATLRERNRIAREIHDNVGHMLTRSILMVGALKTVNADRKLDEPLGQLSDTLNDAMDSIRKSVHDLHDSSVSLEDALRSMIRDFSFCPVHLQYQISPELPDKVRYALIAIAKEALVNIAKHSNATEASITAIEHPGFYQFIIQDNGNTCRTDGFSPGISGEHSGIGLLNIRSRVQALNGILQIQTAQGFRLYLTIPRA